MRLSFGTDGIRGVANEILTPAAALALGRAAADVLAVRRFVVGRDTRLSGPMLESALCAGLAAQGADVVRVGVLPTPAVARICAATGAAGAVVSASHNPYEDNGIKLFGAGGRKLTQAVEQQVEQALHGWRHRLGDPGPIGRNVGSVADDPSASSDYLDWLARRLEPTSLAGWRIVVDAANGAASAFAGELFVRAGATVSVINDRPDGANINDRCGATHLEAVQAAVREAGADVGFALDGDADRCLAVGADGSIVDGDRILVMCAVDRQRRAQLAGDRIVVTVMANLGLHRALAEHGIAVVETAVGDRHVLDALDEHGLVLGGEQSGHIIHRDLAVTGDGLLTAVELLRAVLADGRSFTDAATAAMTRLPQSLVSVKVPAGQVPAVLEAIGGDVDAARRQLADRGRVLVRASGTEPLVRVMVEALTQGEAAEICEQLASRARDSALRLL